MNGHTLAALVSGAQRGDRESVAQLVAEFRPTVMAAATRLLGSPTDAEDVAQEALAVAVERLEQLRDPLAFPGWLMQIVRTRADRRTRGQQWLPLISDLADDAEDAGAAADVADAVERVWRGVEQLPPALRRVVALGDLAGLSQPAVAALLGVPLTTVVNRRRAARRQLRSLVDVESTNAVETLRELPQSVKFFLALRAGDLVAVRAMIDESPELLEGAESWTSDYVAADLVPFANHGTPLLRAVERGDTEMVELLLTLGASTEAPCGCASAESPLWTATVFGRRNLMELLLGAGASPNQVAASGTSPLHAAAARGDVEAALLLLAWGAASDRLDGGGRTPLAWAQHNGHAAVVHALGAASVPTTVDRVAPSEPVDILATGIRAVDLFAPITRGGATLVVPQPYVGHAVLLLEISRRLVRRPSTSVIWCGFPQPPYDRADVEVQLREGGLVGCVPLVLPGAGTNAASARDLLDRTCASARVRAERDGTDIVLVMLSAKDKVGAVERSLGDIGIFGEGSVTAIVVAPIIDDRDTPATAACAPWSGHIEYDPGRAQRAQWPAVSWKSRSRHADEVSEPIRLILQDFGADGADAVDAVDAGERANAVHIWLSQPFAVAEPFNARPGEYTPYGDTVAWASDFALAESRPSNRRRATTGATPG